MIPCALLLSIALILGSARELAARGSLKELFSARAKSSSIRAANHVVNGRILDSSELTYVYTTLDTGSDSRCEGDIYSVSAQVLDLCLTYVYDDSNSPEFDNYTVYTKTEMTSTAVTISYYTDDTCTEILTKLSELYKVYNTHVLVHFMGDPYLNGTNLNNYRSLPLWTGYGILTQMADISSGSCTFSNNGTTSEGASTINYFSITSSTGIVYPASDAWMDRYYLPSDTTCSGNVYRYDAFIADVCFGAFSSSNASYAIRLYETYANLTVCSNSTSETTLGPYPYVSCSYNYEDASSNRYLQERGYYTSAAYYAGGSAADSTSPTPSPVPTSGPSPVISTPNPSSIRVLLPHWAGVAVSLTGIAAHAGVVMWRRLGLEGSRETKEEL